MGFWEAILLGIVQGLTEFLPVSSSGHLALFTAILGNDQLPAENLLFTILVHAATAIATMIVFRKDILDIIKGLFQFQWNEETQFSAKIILSMIPAVCIGLFLEDELEQLFGGNVAFVGFMLLVTAVLLWMASKAKDTQKPVNYRNAFVIGIAQAVAMLPGISRSGATISTSVLLGNDKTKAARFSFLMVIPLIFGKIAKDLLGGELTVSSGNMVPMFAGFIAAFVAGLAACTWMIACVQCFSFAGLLLLFLRFP